MQVVFPLQLSELVVWCLIWSDALVGHCVLWSMFCFIVCCVWSTICVVSLGPGAVCWVLCAAGRPLTSACPVLLTGPGKRVCVMSAASVDWPYFRLQAARPRGGACPQRLSLPDLRGLRQAGQYHWPFDQRGKAHTHIAMETKPLPHLFSTVGTTSYLYLSWHVPELREHSYQASVNQRLCHANVTRERITQSCWLIQFAFRLVSFCDDSSY